MICAVINGPSLTEAQQQISQALTYADLVELRLDLFEFLDLPSLKRLRHAFSLPMIFTLRSTQQGGKYNGTEEQRLTAILSLASLNPDYIDLESDIPSPDVQKIATHSPKSKIILSHHLFTNTPDDLEALYQKMQKTPADLYKIAVRANSSIDTFRLLHWTKNSPKKIIAVAMGPSGQATRILGPIFGSYLTYACLNEQQQTAPGQLTAQELKEKYGYHALKPSTAIYGLIGDPVSRSIGDTTHNAIIQENHLDAVYIKIPVTPQELPEFINMAKKLPFKGLSVTMPLKEHLLPYLDHIDPAALTIGAANTILFKNGQTYGYNTDSTGALNAIEQNLPVKGKHLVILGAGGAAKAIIHEATQRGAKVTILNRHPEKAQPIADRYGCQAHPLNHITQLYQQSYDLIINCTPVGNPIDEAYILPTAWAMDITTLPHETPFLIAAKSKGCRLIHGYRMFIEQAIGQFHLWFPNQIPTPTLRHSLQHHAKKALDIPP